MKHKLSELIEQHLPSLAFDWAAKLHAAEGTCYARLSQERLQEMTRRFLEASLAVLQTGDKTPLKNAEEQLAWLQRTAGFTLQDIGVSYPLLRDTLLALLAAQPWDATTHAATLQVCLIWLDEIALERAKFYQGLLWQEEQARTAQLEGLNRLAASLSHSLDLDTVLQTAMQVACDLTSAEMCRIHLPDEQRRMLCLRTSLNSPAELNEKFSSLSVQDSFAGQAFSSGQLVMVDKQKLLQPASDREPRRVNHQTLSRLPPKTFAHVPLFSKGQSRGVMTLIFEEEHHFDEDEQALLTAIGHQVGVAVENAQLYEQECRQRRIAETLDEVARVVNSSLELAQVLDRVLVELEKVIQYDSAAIVQVKQETIYTVAARGFTDQEAAMRLVAPLTRLPTSQKVIERQRPVVIPDIQTRLDPFRASLADATLIRCMIVVPLVSYEKIVGLLYVNSRKPDYYSTQDAEIVFRFAQQAVVAIVNARLHGELEETVRRRTEEIRRQRDRTAAILQSVADGVVVADLEGQIVSTNPVAEAWLYYSKGERRLENRSLATFIRRLATRDEGEALDVIEFPAWEQQLDAPCWQLTDCTHEDCPAHGQQVSCWQTPEAYCFTAWEWSLKRPSASQVPVCPVRHKLQLVALQAQVAEMKEDDVVQGVVIALRDISRQRALDRLKSQFVSTVSHELRTPLTNIKLYHGLLKRDREEKRQHYMAVMEREIVRLERLIQDILDLSLLEMQEKPPRREIVDVNLLLQEQGEIHTLQAESKGLKLHLAAMPGTLQVHADRNQLRQVLTNLLVNAINYTSEGGEVWLSSGVWHLDGKEWRVTGSISRPDPSVPRPPKGDWAAVSVRDSGVGIAPEDMPRIFDRFYRGVQASMETPGSGLGLAIVREILDLHGGHVLVESKPGVGSTFTVLLPLLESERKLFVLVADDEEHVGRLIRQFLSREGIKVRWVPDGQQALEAIADERPDLLILDLGMPLLDGYQVLERLRAQGDTPSLPVLALSSWAEDKFQRVKRLGAAEFLNKPFSGTVLVDVVKRLIGRPIPPGE
jgi:signal transduction histidine kinase/GAF domain-containing protein/CheY-like chemotaxis protein